MDDFENQLQGAFAAHNGGRHAEAEATCRKLLAWRPADSRVSFLLGMILHRLGRDNEAVELLRRAVELAPDDAAVFNGLGCVYHSLKHYSRAVEAFHRAIELNPRLPDLYYSLGNALFPMGKIDEAAAAFRRAVELNPRDEASWNNLGKTLKELNQFEASVTAYDHALAIKPDYGLAHYGRAISLLALGNLREGLSEYEWRPQRHPRQFLQPRWQGENLAGRTLFLYAEQGFGDAILALRYLASLRRGGARVILECRPELKRLFDYNECADRVIAYGEAIPPFDCYASLISVAGLLGVALETIPRQIPYLRAPTTAVKHAEGLKAGFVWAGNPGHHDDAQRSMRLEELLPILQSPGINFYSLQRPVPERDQAVFKTMPNVEDLAAGFSDFFDTAAALAALDVVICVDTGVAHLAGAMGKPVWLMLQHSPDWRWFLKCGNETPWYPAMRLFRQTQRGEWGPVIARVAEALRCEDGVMRAQMHAR